MGFKVFDTEAYYKALEDQYPNRRKVFKNGRWYLYDEHGNEINDEVTKLWKFKNYGE